MKIDKYTIAQWILRNDANEVTHNLSARRAADVFRLKYPHGDLSADTICQYIKRARAGKTVLDNGPSLDEIAEKSSDLDNTFSITDQIKSNAETAQKAFRIDTNPLEVIPDMKEVFFDIPDSYATYPAPYKLDHIGKRMGVIGDIHFPIHDRPAVLAAHAKLKELKIDSLLLLGDIMDCSNITRHARRKNLNYTWKEELEVGRAYFKSLRVLFPDIPIIYAEGNHENWLQQYILRQARDLEGTYILSDMLKLNEYNIEWVAEDRLFTFGDLFLTHGHKLGIGGGRHVATRLLDKFGVNLMVQHWHRMMSDDKRSLSEKTHGCWVGGCLSDLHPDYNPHNNSTQGLAVVDLMEGGKFIVHQYKILNGKVLD